MGKLRTDSSSQIEAQSSWPPAERDTLTTCPACGGSGKKEVPGQQPGQYRYLGCRWCSGYGSVTKKVHLAFLRWLRILNWNRLRGGRCKHG